MYTRYTYLTFLQSFPLVEVVKDVCAFVFRTKHTSAREEGTEGKVAIDAGSGGGTIPVVPAVGGGLPRRRRRHGRP